MPVARGVQGLEPKPRSREGLDDIHELRLGGRGKAGDILNKLSRKTVDGIDSGEPDETTIRRVLGYLHKAS